MLGRLFAALDALNLVESDFVERLAVVFLSPMAESAAHLHAFLKVGDDFLVEGLQHYRVGPSVGLAFKIFKHEG